MAIGDLLWACPQCGRVGGIRRADTCTCGASFRRAMGAMIRASMPDGRVITRSPAEWLELLPDPASLLDRDAGHEDRPVRAAGVLAREALDYAVVRWRRRFLNRVERYGPARAATLELYRDRLTYRPEAEDPHRWPFDQLTAVQASSNALQIKCRARPLVSFRFPDDSVFLWEMLLHAALRDHYRRTGRGTIVEFQPRIIAR